MESATCIIHTDGGSRGNPGPAGYGFVLSRTGEDDLEENDYLGLATNNIAEYTAVVRALERALELGMERVVLKSDSELMVKQMNGQYKVKNPGLLPLYEEASRLRRKFKEVKFQHVRRDYNTAADRLANEAMDSRASTTGKVERPRGVDGPTPAPMPVKGEREDPVRAEGMKLLQSAAAAWASGQTTPSPAEVWEKIVALLGGRGVGPR